MSGPTMDGAGVAAVRELIQQAGRRAPAAGLRDHRYANIARLLELARRLSQDEVSADDPHAAQEAVDVLRQLGGGVVLSAARDVLLVDGAVPRGPAPLQAVARRLAELLGPRSVTLEASAGALAELSRLVRPEGQDSSPRPASVPVSEFRAASRNVVRFLADALLELRAAYRNARAGQAAHPPALSRLALRLVDLCEERAPLLALTTMSSVHRDDAGRAIHIAVLAVATARQLLADRLLLAELGAVALASSVGRTASPEPGSLLSHALVEGMLLHGISPSGARRVIMGTEAAMLRSSGVSVHTELATTAQAELIELSRRYVRLIAPSDDAQGGVPGLEALAKLTADTTVDRTMLRLLVRAVGLPPVGTLLEMSDGTWAVSAGPSRNHNRPYLPLLFVLTDGAGQALPRPEVLDLGMEEEREGLPRVRAVIPPGDAQLNVARTLLTV